MYETVQTIGILAVFALWLFVAVKVIVRLVKSKYGPVKTVKAQVVDKFKEEKLSRIYGSTAKKERYYVVFSIEGKKRSFRVSEFSYGGYQCKEKGTLKYKGDRIIDFS